MKKKYEVIVKITREDEGEPEEFCTVEALDKRYKNRLEEETNSSVEILSSALTEVTENA